MKRFQTLLLALFVAMAASAQTNDGLNVVTLRVGDHMPLMSQYDASLPISATYEHELVSDAWGFESLIFGIGGVVGMRNYTFDQCAWLKNPATGLVEKNTDGTRSFYHKYDDMLIGLRGYVHYDVLGQLFDLHSDHIDTYAVVMLGVCFNRFSHHDISTGGDFFPVYDDPNAHEVATVNGSSFVPGLQLGCRYWITPNIGVTVEAGYDGFSIFNGGLQVCF